MSKYLASIVQQVSSLKKGEAAFLEDIQRHEVWAREQLHVLSTRPGKTLKEKLKPRASKDERRIYDWLVNQWHEARKHQSCVKRLHDLDALVANAGAQLLDTPKTLAGATAWAAVPAGPSQQAATAPPLAKRPRLETPPAPAQQSQVKASRCLRGLNIQYPFSQLLLQGVKTIEVRRYELGYKQYALPEEDTWLVETKGPAIEPSRNALVQGCSVGPRPAAAHIVGVIKFSFSEAYDSIESFSNEAPAHRIQAGGSYDWDGVSPCYRWHVASARRLASPVYIGGDKQMTGFGPRRFTVSFASESSAT